LKSAALGMKGSLVNNGRCPKCTLKPPCKHYEKAEDLPNIVEVQPSILKKNNIGLNNAGGSIPPLYPNKDNQSNLLANQSKFKAETDT